MTMPKAQAPAVPVTVDDLLARGAALIKRIEDAQRQAVDDPARIEEAGKLVTELNSIPVMVGELRRRQVLEHIATMAREAQRLSKEVDAAEARMAELQEENRADLKELRRTAQPAARTEIQKRLYASNKPIDAATAELMTKRAKLDALYSLAVRSYGIFLDQSPRQLQHRQGLHPTLSYAAASSETAWEQAAQRIAAREREQAQRNLLGNVIRPLVWAWR